MVSLLFSVLLRISLWCRCIVSWSIVGIPSSPSKNRSESAWTNASQPVPKRICPKWVAISSANYAARTRHTSTKERSKCCSRVGAIVSSLVPAVRNAARSSRLTGKRSSRSRNKARTMFRSRRRSRRSSYTRSTRRINSAWTHTRTPHIYPIRSNVVWN